MLEKGQSKKTMQDEDAFDFYKQWSAGSVIGEDPNNPDISAWHDPKLNGIEVPVIPIEEQMVSKDWAVCHCGNGKEEAGIIPPVSEPL